MLSRFIQRGVLFLLAAGFLAAPIQGADAAGQITGKYSKIVERMKALETKYSRFAKIFTMGVNDDGVEILGLRISTSPEANDPQKAAHLVVGTHHGNEGAAPEFVMAFIENLLGRYDSQELFRTNLLSTEWHVIPVLNISGYNANTRAEKGYDPNRDYPGPCISAVGGKLKSIKALMEFMKTRIFAGSLTVHGYLGALTYPWGVDVSDTHTADHNYFAQITEKAAEKNGYRHGTSTDVVYPCDGAFEDYAYWRHGIWSLLLELTSGSATDISTTVEAMTVYFDEVAATPSLQNKFSTQCQRSGRRDLAIE